MRSELLDSLHVRCEPPTEYQLTSCHGQETRLGRKATGLVVESLDGNCRLKLPTVIECDDIPSSKEEIPSPAVARNYPHLKDIEKDIHPIDPSAQVLVLIGRDLVAAHHVLDQRIGQEYAPYAQKLNLGWVVIGETCLNGIHLAGNVITSKTHIQSSAFTPCPNKFKAREDGEFRAQDVFIRSRDDNKIGMSVEDRDFLIMMEHGFWRDQSGN